MRKDKIEERILELEKEIQILKTDHKEGVESILTEMRTFQNFIIEERISSILQQLEERYKKLFMDILVENAACVMEDNIHDPCILNKRQECHEFFISRLRSIANASEYSNPALNDLEYESNDNFVA
ncbi:hypothetical protein [Methanobacterium sp.]|uniref:hypothetical protein n=1 Tax=Methanobacterium sp. TaxID=2164 RepID=UPI003C7599AB